VSNPQIDRYNTLLTKVNAVLYEVWAPIGFVGGLPRDEYEGYAIRCLSLLTGGVQEHELAAYLVTAGAGLSDDTDSLVEQSAKAARHLMQYLGDARAINP
jgi:hypothetical protein